MVSALNHEADGALEGKATASAGVERERTVGKKIPSKTFEMTNLSRSETVMYVNQKFSDKNGQNSIQS